MDKHPLKTTTENSRTIFEIFAFTVLPHLTMSMRPRSNIESLFPPLKSKPTCGDETTSAKPHQGFILEINSSPLFFRQRKCMVGTARCAVRAAFSGAMVICQHARKFHSVR